ncbi:hypothetical protein HZC07_01995 [Candidatus Micrarchaeota archaeon]|nr:hypothetical protein [Candidatus Micrarchaeota archaeon]
MDDMSKRSCELCGYVIGTYSIGLLCGRCQALSHEMRLSIQNYRKLAIAIERLVSILEKSCENEY